VRRPALAVEPFVVKDIRVEGIQRTEAGTVFSYLPVRVGETFDDDKGIAADQGLYATGFFKDVRLEEENGVLVVLVEERPAISSVEFTGTKEFEKDMLVKALKEIGVGETKIFDKASVDRAEQELKRQYLSHGLYGVKITTTVTPIERNRVNIMFNVDEGDVAKIKQINIVGNKAFSDKELRDLLQLNTSAGSPGTPRPTSTRSTKLTGDIEVHQVLLPEPRLPRDEQSNRPRCRSRRTRRTSTSPSTSPKARSTRSRASSSKARPSAAKKNSSS
jgi:outer membrane protein insertion porin family